ncbi:MAG TPA: lipid-A-disaccharide synthase, partial [Longimicrobiales bacterium]|nr:lipid-A-disaccharide synthase [Longimicrobiales bacterium]
MSRRTVLLLAGEPSGDAHGGALARAIARRLPGVRLTGTGGPAMAAAGVELLATLDDLAVMGFAEIVPRLPVFARLGRAVRSRLAGGEADLLVAIDFPGFNLRAARWARDAGVRVLYYVAPKVWAWRPGRARTLAAADEVAVVLPFEEAFLRERGVRATFVGHPLLDPPREAPCPEDAFRRRWGLDPERPLLALLPGSRRQEIGRHLRLFEEAAHAVREALPDVLPVLARAPSLSRAAYAGAAFPVVDDARALLRHARAALVKSGTATLEAALERTPMVVAYRTSAATWALARRLVRVEHVSLPNLVAGEGVVPEHVQADATP